MAQLVAEAIILPAENKEGEKIGHGKNVFFTSEALAEHQECELLKKLGPGPHTVYCAVQGMVTLFHGEKKEEYPEFPIEMLQLCE